MRSTRPARIERPKNSSQPAPHFTVRGGFFIWYDAPMGNPTPHQLAVMIQKAAGLRHDVKKMTVQVAEDHADTLLITCVYYDGQQRRAIETKASKILERGETFGALLDRMLGELPTEPISQKVNRSDRLIAERRRWFEATPQQMIGMEKALAHAPPDPEASQWQKMPEDVREQPLPDRVLPDQVPPPEQARPQLGDEYFYVEPTTGQRLPKMTRQQMIDSGYDSDRRHEQYRRQHGKHPDDE